MDAKLGLDTSERAPLIRRLCRYLSERSPEPTVAVEGLTHVVIYVNPAFARFVGRERADLVGRTFAEAVPEGHKNGCLALLDRVFRTGVHERLAEQEHRHSLPGLVSWSYSVWAILGNDERPAGVMIQVTDATEVATFRQQVVGMNEALLVSAARQHELAAAAESLSVRLHRQGHELTVTLPAEPVPLDADPTRLAQVFMNLLNNAAKYSERDGHIWLSAERDGNGVMVRVRDAGIGIPAANLPHIFEVFVQVDDKWRRSQGGLGIGLGSASHWSRSSSSCTGAGLRPTAPAPGRAASSSSSCRWRRPQTGRWSKQPRPRGGHGTESSSWTTTRTRPNRSPRC